jgi:hypothetical protein
MSLWQIVLPTSTVYEHVAPILSRGLWFLALGLDAFGFALAFPVAGFGVFGVSALVGFFAFGVPAVCLVLVMLSIPVVFVFEVVRVAYYLPD